MKCETGHSQEDVGEKPEQSSQLFWAHPESQSLKHVWKHQIDHIDTYSTVCVVVRVCVCISEHAADQ